MPTDIGSLIRQMRKASGMSQMRLADQIGVSYQQVQKYEKGASKLSVPRLMQIAEVFGVPVTAFLQDDTMDSGSLKKSEQSNLTGDEFELLALYRRLTRKKMRDSILELLKDLVKMVEGK